MSYKPRKGIKQFGFSYLEFVIAMSIASSCMLGLMQFSQKQHKATSETLAKLQAQLLLMNIQSRLALNKSYIRETQQGAVYFARTAEHKCDKAVANECHAAECNRLQLAQSDLAIMTCLTKEFGLIYELTLQPHPSLQWVNEIIASVSINAVNCAVDNCKLAQQRIWL